MKAMVLAAGFGRRLRPLTDHTPKPLLQAGEKTLIEYQLDRIAACGINEVIINLHHLGEQIRRHIDSLQLPLDITFSDEEVALETGGGIRRALPLLGDDPFLVVSADTYMEGDLGALLDPLPAQCDGRLLMTANPAHHPTGDFAVGEDGWLVADGECLTYSGIGLLSPALIAGETDGVFPLRRVFDRSIEQGRLLGEVHRGFWWDVGTEERLATLKARLESGLSE